MKIRIILACIVRREWASTQTEHSIWADIDAIAATDARRMRDRFMPGQRVLAHDLDAHRATDLALLALDLPGGLWIDFAHARSLCARRSNNHAPSGHNARHQTRGKNHFERHNSPNHHKPEQ